LKGFVLFQLTNTQQKIKLVLRELYPKRNEVIDVSIQKKLKHKNKDLILLTFYANKPFCVESVKTVTQLMVDMKEKDKSFVILFN